MTIGFGLALLFSKKFRGCSFFRGVTMISWLLPVMVAGLLFKFMFASSGGIINQFLMGLHILDGANKIQTLFNITIPMIKPAIMSVLTLGFVYTFKVSDLVWVMTKGGPVNATELVSTYAYRLSFEEFQFSEGAAANVLFLILLVVGGFYIKLINDEEEAM